MLEGLYIFVDDEFQDPIYADPESDDLDPDVWETLCESINDGLEGDGKTDGNKSIADLRVHWRTFLKTGMTFSCVVQGSLKTSTVDKFLQSIARQYMDEIDDIRHPDRGGVADVVIDVIPPWEDDDDQ